MTDRPAVLEMTRLLDAPRARLHDAFRIHPWTTPDALGPVAASIRAVVSDAIRGVPDAVIAALPNLEIVAQSGVGTDRTDLEELKRRGIHFTTSQGVLTDDVADLALGLLIDALRGISAGDRFIRAGKWRSHPVTLGHTLTGKTVGIVGLGQIGRAIAARCAALRMKIAYHARHERADAPYSYFESVTALAAASDVLMIAAPGTPQTAGMVGDEVLSALGRDGWLVNIGRGSVVDEPALVRALVEGRIAGAGLDVFAHEPDVPAELLALDNVVLQPHRGSATVEIRTAMSDLVVDNLLAHFSGKPLLTALF